ncbi:MAG: ribonuclease R [Flavobacteriales bacterium]|nr:MAG: ribonuclease R [Flavobacteriales bacterium]
MERKKSKKGEKRDLKKEILNVFYRYENRPLNYKQLAKQLNIRDSKVKNLISNLLIKLAEKGQLQEVHTGQYKLKQKRTFITGTVDLLTSGAAFIISDETDEDAYIPRNRLNGALHRDTVKVALRSKKKGRPEGEILEIISRAKTEYVGTVEVSGKFAFLIPDDPKMPIDIFIPSSGMKGTRDGQKVIVQITEWPEGYDESPVGEIVEVLGSPGEHETEMYSILAEFGLPRGFPKALEKEAEKIPTEISKEEIKKRRDFRNVTTFTIDPADAKDFDDALSVKKLKTGNFEIGVHIADVTHYVKPNSKIDEEAAKRGTSIYLVDRVIPMLPEILSNVVCSLRPNEDKLCFSAVFEMNEKGEVLGKWFGRTVIHSDKRFTYEEVQEIIEGKRQKAKDKNDFKVEILELNDLAKKLRKKRMQNGAIAFEKTEVRFELDEKGNPIGVRLKEQKDSHKLIEEFMLLANRTIAKAPLKSSSFLSKKDGKQNISPPSGERGGTWPFVYRVHDAPDGEKLTALSKIIKQFGYQITMGSRNNISSSINQLLADVKGKGEAHMIETLAIRTMAKADYTTKNIGHYGLAFDYYTHFTSPIRRYPDMMVHRLLEAQLKSNEFLTPEKGKQKDILPFGKDLGWVDLEAACNHASKMERLAEGAERASVKYKQVEFMQDKVGEVFTGVISGVIEWGLFVELNETMCEGMVRLRDIEGDYFVYEQENYRIVGSRTKKVYQLGDAVTVRVKKADLFKKQLDFALV